MSYWGEHKFSFGQISIALLLNKRAFRRFPFSLITAVISGAGSASFAMIHFASSD